MFRPRSCLRPLCRNHKVNRVNRTNAESDSLYDNTLVSCLDIFMLMRNHLTLGTFDNILFFPTRLVFRYVNPFMCLYYMFYVL